MSKVLKLPHIKQIQEGMCGAAALTMVYRFYGFKQKQSDIWQRLSIPRQATTGKFIDTKTMITDSVNQNFCYIAGHVVWQNKSLAVRVLRKFISLDIPVIICQRWRENSPLGHYRVVIGIEKDGVIINDSENKTPKSKIIYKSFMHKWEKINGSTEVLGGEFVAIFPRKLCVRVRRLKLTLTSFSANISQFSATGFKFL